jgi:site-specific recombinase XerD
LIGVSRKVHEKRLVQKSALNLLQIADGPCHSQKMDKKYSYRVVTAPAGFDGYSNRRNYYFKTQLEKSRFMRKIDRWKAEQRCPADTFTFTELHKEWIGVLSGVIQTTKELRDIVAHWEATAKAVEHHMSVAALRDAYLLHRKEERKTTTGEDRSISAKLANRFGNKPVHQVTAAECQSFVATGRSDQTKRNYYKVGSLMFDFARRKRAVVANPFNEFDRPNPAYTVPEVLTPKELEHLLLTAEADPELKVLVPFLALTAFAGLRHCELVEETRSEPTLDWSKIYWDKALIEIEDEVAKQTSRKGGNRRFLPMEAALVHWLKPYRQSNGPVVPICDWKLARLRACLESAAHFQIPDNALRHSYASYWLARETREGAGQLAKRMGNSEAVCKRHYLETLTPHEGSAWFGLRRSRVKQRSCAPSSVVVPIAPLPVAA